MSGFDLRASPFYALALSPRANRAAIAEAFEAALDGGQLDETAATRAQQTLMAAKPRLLAEVSWLLGVAPNRAHALVDATTAPSLTDLSSLPALAGANLAAHWCSVGAPDFATIGFLVEQQGVIEPTAVVAAVNAERTVSGFGQVDGGLVADTLSSLRTKHLEAAHDALTKLDDPGSACLELVTEHHDGVPAIGAFVDGLVERFDAWAHPELRRLRDELFAVLSSIFEQGRVSHKDRVAIGRILSGWQTLVGPSQFIAAYRGLVDARTKEVFERIRSTTLHLNNEKSEPEHALALVNLAQPFFSAIPEVGERLATDLSKLEELVEDKERESLFKPLATVLQTAQEHPEDLAPSLRRGDFRTAGSGLAGTLYRAFDSTARASGGTEYADRPFVGIRSLAIALNNESSAPDEALVLVEALQTYSGAPLPSEIRTRLEEDARSLKRVSLQKQLAAAAHKQEFGRVIALAKSLEPVTDDSEERTTLGELVTQAVRQRRQKYVKWAFYGGLAMLFIWGGLSDEPDAPSRSPSTRVSSGARVPNDGNGGAGLTASLLEVQPPVSSARVLSLPELRYCRFESERIDVISKLLGDGAAQVLIERFNASVTDFNARCSENQFRKTDGATIDRQIATAKAKLELESRQRIAEWSGGIQR